MKNKTNCFLKTILFSLEKKFVYCYRIVRKKKFYKTLVISNEIQKKKHNTFYNKCFTCV